jgi:redox-sensitive bicupin YhaK (pirin superfamily)
MPEIESIDIIRADARHFSDFGWLKTRWLFSFASYYDPHNIQFGALRVFNDDVVAPGTGFPTHSHEEMEIITIVLDGEMTHQDSMGNQAVIRAGDVQRMSAGTGLTHSEYNLADRPVHFYQIWIFPDVPRLEPSYDQRTFSADAWRNRLLPVASGQGFDDVVTINTAATIYRGQIDAGSKLNFANTAGRRVFVYLMRGEMRVDGLTLYKEDQARVDTEKPLVLEADSEAEFILVDVPSCKGWGYSDTILRGGRK